MKSLQEISESLLSQDFDMDVPDTIIEFVKLCRPLKFKVDDDYLDQSVRSCQMNGGLVVKETINKMIKLFDGLTPVKYNDYIHDTGVTLIGVQNTNLIIGIPQTHDMISIYGNAQCMTLYDFSNENVKFPWSFDTRQYQWFAFPVESYSMIRAALLK